MAYRSYRKVFPRCSRCRNRHESPESVALAPDDLDRLGGDLELAERRLAAMAVGVMATWGLLLRVSPALRGQEHQLRSRPVRVAVAFARTGRATVAIVDVAPGTAVRRCAAMRSPQLWRSGRKRLNHDPHSRQAAGEGFEPRVSASPLPVFKTMEGGGALWPVCGEFGVGRGVGRSCAGSRVGDCIAMPADTATPSSALIRASRRGYRVALFMSAVLGAARGRSRHW